MSVVALIAIGAVLWIAAVLLIVAFFRGASKMEPQRQDDQTGAGEELLRLERGLAEHRSLGRNFADREVV